MSRDILKRNGWIEFCRFIFVMCVASHHSMLFGEHGYIPLVNGYLAVEFFYILTGYFLFSSAMSRSIAMEESSGFTEAWKRLKKIYPYFLNAWLMSFILCHVTHGHNDTGNWLADLVCGIPQLFFLSMSDLAGGFLGYWDYLGTLWYLSALLFAILLVYPLIIKYKTLYASSIGPMLALLIYGGVFFVFHTFGVVNERLFFLALGNLRAVAGLSLGSFCCFLVQALPDRELNHRGKIVFSVGQLLTFAAILLLMNYTNEIYGIILIILFCMLIIFTFAGNTYLNALFSRPLFLLLGKFSMIVFITQSLAYMYPWLPYPEQWRWKYLVMMGYVILLSLANAGIVCLFAPLFKTFSLKKLWAAESDAQSE